MDWCAIKKDMTGLQAYGWNETFNAAAKAIERPDWIPARVLAEHRHLYQVTTGNGELRGEVSGRFRTAAQGTGDFPAVGDWVLVEPRFGEGTCTLQAVLPRCSRFSRKAAGSRTDEQVMAANFNTVLLVMSLNHDFNLRRLERYLVMAWDSGAQPVLVLTKKDVCSEPEPLMEQARTIAAGVPVIALSAVTGDGMELLEPWLIPGQTLVVLGSSGAGKSTLMNRLAGEELALTQEVRADDARGRHTTTHRELFLLESGILMLDTPGIRELQLWESDSGLEEAFADIQSIALQCRFRDCTHYNEPGCAIQTALRTGAMPKDRYESYLKLEREMRYVTQKNTPAAREAIRAFGKSVTRMQRAKRKLGTGK